MLKQLTGHTVSGTFSEAAKKLLTLAFMLCTSGCEATPAGTLGATTVLYVLRPSSASRAAL